VTPYHIVDSAAVPGDITIQTVGLPGDGVDKKLAGRYRHPVHGIVRRHDGRKIVIPDECPVGRQVIFPHVPLIQAGTSGVAVKFSIVGQVVLSAGNRLQVKRVIPHHPLDEPFPDLRYQEGILAESLGSSSPPWITGGFYHRRPVGKRENEVVIETPGLIGHYRGLPPDQFRVPGGSHGDTVGKRGGRHSAVVVAAHYPVERLSPHIVAPHSQPRHGSHGIAQQALLLFGGHP